LQEMAVDKFEKPGKIARRMAAETTAQVLAETDAVWYEAAMALADNGWDCPRGADWTRDDVGREDVGRDDVVGEDMVHEDVAGENVVGESECTEHGRVSASDDRVSAAFQWLGTRMASATTHDAPIAVYRLHVEVPPHLARLLAGEVRLMEATQPGRQLTNSLPILRSYVDDFFGDGWTESARLRDNGIMLRFASKCVGTNPVHLHIDLAAMDAM
jgi:hypothetical protein